LECFEQSLSFENNSERLAKICVPGDAFVYNWISRKYTWLSIQGGIEISNSYACDKRRNENKWGIPKALKIAYSCRTLQEHSTT